jgi:hypothetical protein
MPVHKGKSVSPKRPTIKCNNLGCKFCEKLDEPVTFSWNKYNFTPFDDSLVTGRCIRHGYDFMPVGVATKNLEYKMAMCHVSEHEGIHVCDRNDCLHNENRICMRDVIWVNKTPLLPEAEYWHCRCFSDKKFAGHRDWSALLNPDKTAKGGHVDDDIADKMYKDSLKFKSFGTGHRDAKEPFRKKS